MIIILAMIGGSVYIMSGRRKGGAVTEWSKALHLRVKMNENLKIPGLGNINEITLLAHYPPLDALHRRVIPETLGP